ncbi:transcription antitermination factor NusB [Chondromyces crocatus]|uniref:Transcription antitermination protein NusB n=1 Tax=Chondromyces crocatus TaxID=52 RepID=A0A0K1ER43_CHOCO|nr:transcription antitermination factor NusB [Chondromyces crocatus]AKT43405.1 N utilization substance protein B [Chondromyces crocatus]
MGARSTGRESALQMLFAIEVNADPAPRVVTNYWRETPGDPEGRDYADEIVLGIAGDLDKVDGIIRKASTNWRIERMARVDRNVLRLGAWELLHRQDVPRAVILDEAVELAKRYGSEDSGSFVNGVLDKIAENLGRLDQDR